MEILPGGPPAPREPADHLVDRLTRLQAVTAALAEALSVEQVAQVVVGHASDALRAAHGTVYVLEGEGSGYTLVAHRNRSEEARARWQRITRDVPLPVPTAIARGEPVWLEDRARMMAAFPFFEQAPELAVETVQALAALPLRLGARTLGCVSFTFAEPRRFDADERQFVLALVAQCAQALDRARLYEAEHRARTQAEGALSTLDALLAASPVGISFVDRELRYVRMNEAMAAFSGTRPDAVLGRTPAEVLGDMHAGIEREMRHILETGQPLLGVELEGELPAGSGQRHHWLATRFPVRAASGEIMGVGSVVADITERKRMEARLRESEERFRLTVDHAPVGMALVGMDGRFLRVNEALCESLGYPLEELMGLRFREVTHPDDVPKEEELGRRLLEGGPSRFRLELRYVRKDGTVRDAILHASLLRDGEGRPVHFILQAEDITELKRVVEERERLLAAVERERQWLNLVMERLPTGVMLYERAGEVVKVRANRRAEELMGRPLGPGTEPRSYLWQIHDAAGRPLSLAELPSSRALRGEVLSGGELIIRRPDGTQFPARTSVAPVREKDGRIVGAVSVFDDISNLKSFERLRDEWTAMVANDLREQAGLISFSAQVAQRLSNDDGARDQRARELERIRAITRQLDRLVDDLVDASRIEAKRLKLAPAEVDVAALAREAVARLAYVLEGFQVRVEASGAVNAWADAARLEQVLGNLLSNAVRYGEPGSEIRLEVEGRAEEVEVSITNHGPGLPPHELKRLFQRLPRGGEPGAAKVPGIALGLYICKGLVEAHGGRIWAESTPGNFTRFRFTLPRAKAR